MKSLNARDLKVGDKIIFSSTDKGTFLIKINESYIVIATDETTVCFRNETINIVANFKALSECNFHYYEKEKQS